MTNSSRGGSIARGRNSIQMQIPKTHSTPTTPGFAIHARNEVALTCSGLQPGGIVVLTTSADMPIPAGDTVPGPHTALEGRKARLQVLCWRPDVRANGRPERPGTRWTAKVARSAGPWNYPEAIAD